jgi:hypothetical protein
VNICPDHGFKGARKGNKPFFVLSRNKKFWRHSDYSLYPVLPQHEPGPAHPAEDGDLPQQEVSPGPGSDWPERPVRELVADMSFSVRTLPQLGQAMGVLPLVTITSFTWLQSLHAIS